MGVINWVAFGGVLVDLVIISIIASNAFWGYRRGLVGVIFKILTFIISLLIMFVLYKPVSNTIMEHTKIDEWLSQKIYENLEGTTLGDGQLLDYSDTGSNNNVSKAILDEVNSFVQEGLRKSTGNIIAYVADNVSVQMVRIGTMLLLFIVSRFLLLFVRFIAEVLASLPIIKMFNRSGGLVYGVVKGFLVAYVILAVFSIASPFISTWGVLDAIQDSTLGSKMYNDNVVIDLLTKI